MLMCSTYYIFLSMVFKHNYSTVHSVYSNIISSRHIFYAVLQLSVIALVMCCDYVKFISIYSRYFVCMLIVQFTCSLDDYFSSS